MHGIIWNEVIASNLGLVRSLEFKKDALDFHGSQKQLKYVPQNHIWLQLNNAFFYYIFAENSRYQT